MAARRPQTIEDFAAIFGVGQKKIERFGDIFIGVIKSYLK